MSSVNEKPQLKILNKETKDISSILPEQEDIKKDLYLSSKEKAITEETLGYEAETPFESLRGSITEETMKAIEEYKFPHMTAIQAKSIPKLLDGYDLRGKAKTGSGKTLAFLIPVIELIARLKFEIKQGTGAIIISPTRELALQIFVVLKKVIKYHKISYGLIIGGTNRNAEARNLVEGRNIIVATPGRLLDHLQNTKGFMYKQLSCLVIDEADRILDVGFEKVMKQIITLLPKNRQTILFSATMTSKTEELGKLSLQSERLIEVDVDSDTAQATTDGLKQTYVVCPMDKRFLLLYSFLKKNRENRKKVMVYFSSCMVVKFYSELLNFLDIPVDFIHGRKSQSFRTATFLQFSKAEEGILLCTNVAARGWDIPAVDWIVQYDPPDDPKEYIHRVGRTARAGKNGEALLFLTEQEIGFRQYLKNQNVHVDEMQVDWSKIDNIQAKLEQIILKDPSLKMSAKKAFTGYVRSFQANSLKDIFDVSTLDLKKVGKCFGLGVPPSIKIKHKSTKNKRKKGGHHGSTNKKKMKMQ